MDTQAIRKAAEIAGGQTALGKLVSVSQGLVWQWCEGRLKVRPERSADIERATNGVVTRYMLRPDVFGELPSSDLQEAG